MEPSSPRPHRNRLLFGLGVVLCLAMTYIAVGAAEGDVPPHWGVFVGFAAGLALIVASAWGLPVIRTTGRLLGGRGPIEMDDSSWHDEPLWYDDDFIQFLY